jgi:opacity protein-like surface antigen
VLQGRTGFKNINETTIRFGAGISYLPTKNWIVSVTYDYDKVDSDDPNRLLSRNRVSLSANYVF